MDNLREHYLDVDTTLDLYVQFPSFDVHTFNKNYFIFIQKSRKVDFKTRWYMRPDYVSYDFYNTVIYWPLILFINNAFNIEEFKDFDYILVPPFSLILDLSKDRILDNKAIPLQDENEGLAKINSFYKQYPLDKLELERRNALKSLVDSTSINSFAIKNVIKTETFTLDGDDITNQYVDLQYEPDNVSSITLRINNFNIAQKYNYDYTLKYNDSDKKVRISWKTTDIIENNEDEIDLPASMEDYISEDDILTIKYSVSVTYKISDGEPSL